MEDYKELRKLCDSMTEPPFAYVLSPTVKKGNLNVNNEYLLQAITKLPALLDEVEAEEKSHEKTMTERDGWEDMLQKIDLALGGSGEWSNLRDCGDEALKAADTLQAQLQAKDKEIDFTKGTLVQYFGENKWRWSDEDVLGIISHTHFDDEELHEAIKAALNKKGSE